MNRENKNKKPNEIYFNKWDVGFVKILLYCVFILHVLSVIPFKCPGLICLSSYFERFILFYYFTPLSSCLYL